ncbi:rhoptry neck protein RON2, partial [Cardiosporidium cionae]
MLIDREYAEFPENQRRVEFHRSMQEMHMTNLWKMIYGIVMPNLLHPNQMGGMEKSFSKSQWLKSLSDPLAQSSFRMLLKGDITMKYLDRILPKSMKNQFKEMQFGRATLFANVMSLAGSAHIKMGNAGIGMTLREQAPFMGNSINQWIKYRQEQQKRERRAYLSLATMGFLALSTYTDFLSHAAESGEAALTQKSNALVEECFGCGQLCICDAISPSSAAQPQPVLNDVTVSPGGLALHDVTKLFLFSAFGALVWPTIVISTWDIISSKSKTIARILFSFQSSELPRMMRWLKRSKFGRWAKKKINLKKSKAEKRAIEIALQKAEAEKKAIVEYVPVE